MCTTTKKYDIIHQPIFDLREFIMDLLRKVMTRDDLHYAGMKHVGKFTKDGKLTDLNVQEFPHDANIPGFYFFLNTYTDEVWARFYIGRQRTKGGLQKILSQLRTQRGSTAIQMMNADTYFRIYYVSPTNMKPLTNAFGKSTLGQMFTRQHSEEYQNFEEMNRMLNDNFIFVAQKK